MGYQKTMLLGKGDNTKESRAPQNKKTAFLIT
jgi:hypothetical protein